MNSIPGILKIHDFPSAQSHSVTPEFGGQHRNVPTCLYPIYSLLRFVRIWNSFVLLYHSLLGSSALFDRYLLTSPSIHFKYMFLTEIIVMC